MPTPVVTRLINTLQQHRVPWTGKLLNDLLRIVATEEHQSFEAGRAVGQELEKTRVPALD